MDRASRFSDVPGAADAFLASSQTFHQFANKRGLSSNIIIT